MNSHDAELMASLFADTYESAQPVHPARAFRGRSQVRNNWTSVFAGVPDFRADLVASAIDGDVEWGEWDWRGRYRDGTPFAMRGVTILLAQDGLVTRMRLYLEPVDADLSDIDQAVEELYRHPNRASADAGDANP